MSLRVSQPLCPYVTVTSSVHAGPNWLRSYPVLGARPLIASVASLVDAAEASSESDDAGGLDANVASEVGAVLGIESARP
ncbi:hypothetical protein A5690_16285 [Mycobacterium intracellulare]|nr:hypothetical protein A5690_16285 [Mycobacterium intracellulare]